MVKQQSTNVTATKTVKKQPRKPEPETVNVPEPKKKAWRPTVGGLLLLVIVLAVLPFTRNGFLNTIGVRVNTSLTVLDATTQLPLQHADVQLGNLSGQTNDSGIVRFSHLKLGSHAVSISKVAFATLEQNVSLGWGSNVLPGIPLKATGTQYRFTVTDYLSGKPVTTAEAVSGPSSALSSSSGTMVLTVKPTAGQPTAVTITAAGYRSDELQEQPHVVTTTAVSLVPLGKDTFVSQTNGHYNVYKSDLDGQNQQLLLAGTGLENSNITLVPSPDQKAAALIATRDNVHDASGYLLYAIVMINVSNGSITTLNHGDYIQAIGWLGTRFIYEETVAGAGTTDPSRTQLVSYDYATNHSTELATAAQFNAVTIAQGTVYYAIDASDTVHPAVLYEVKADGSGNQPIFDQEVWTILQSNYNTFYLETPKGWYDYTLGGGQPKSMAAPASYQNLSYFDNSSSTTSVWNENQGSNGVLLIHNNRTGKDTTLASQAGLTLPIIWVNNTTIIYRVTTAQDTADYVISTQGGGAHKINDVSATFGAAQG